MKKRIIVYVFIIVGYACLISFLKKILKTTEFVSNERRKFFCYYKTIIKWSKRRAEGASIGQYLENNGVHTVAIYGAGDIGKLLYKELESSCVRVKYFIDMYESECDEVAVYKLNDKLENVDAIIVTPYLEFDAIAERLNDVIQTEVISFEDIIYDY